LDEKQRFAWKAAPLAQARDIAWAKSQENREIVRLMYDAFGQPPAP
jgi:hypothetical protein